MRKEEKLYTVVRVVDGKPHSLASFDLHDYEDARALAIEYHEGDVERGPDAYWNGPPRDYGVCHLELVEETK